MNKQNTISKLREYRLIGISIFDVVLALFLFYILDSVVNYKFFRKFGYKYYLSIIPIGIISHLLIKQKTHLNTQLFSKELNYDSISIKILVLLCFAFLFI